MGYLTPSTIPAAKICRVLIIPDSEEMIANVNGALQLLTFPENWTPYGAVTPEDAAAAMVPMFDGFTFNTGGCRMIGEIICFAAVTPPDPRWFQCDGSSLLRTSYPDLFAVIGTAYGAADSTHFNLPDLQGRVPVGSGNGAGLTPRSDGDSFGEETHQLSTAELASHSHTDSGHAHTDVPALPNATTIGPGAPQPTAIPGIGSTGIASANITSTGSDTPHNNLQPSCVISYFIVGLA